MHRQQARERIAEDGESFISKAYFLLEDDDDDVR
jgi:hypothetical protein